MGFEEVACFRASGNVVFAAGPEPVKRLAARIERGLEAALGSEVVVFLRSAAAVRAIAAHEPFPAADVEASKGKLQVALLPGKPAAGARKAVLAHATDEDRLAFAGSELYWLPSGGISDSALDLRAIEREAGPWTMRTQGTVAQMAAKFFGAGV